MIKKHIRLVTSLIGLLPLPMLLLTGGCQNPDQGYGQPDANAREWREKAELAQAQPVPVPEEGPLFFKDDPKTEEASVEPPAPPLPTVPVETMSLNREVQLPVLLRAMAKGAGITMIIGDEVDGTVRLNLAEMTAWDELFTQLLETKGLIYEWDGSIMRVLSQADIDRQTATEQALKAREEARRDRLQSAPQELALYRVRYADSARLAASLRAGLDIREEDAGRVTLTPDEDTGLLIINAPPNIIERSLRLAERLDQPARQILIKATIVQTTSETARELGVQWGMYLPNEDNGRLQIGVGSDPADWDGFNANFPADFTMEDGGFTFGAIRTTPDQVLRAQLTALQKDGRLKIISNPSITTLDKQTALIESGEERPFQSASGTGLNTTPTVEFKEALLSLEVTPQVIDGQWIKLQIQTSKDEFDDTGAVIIDGTLQVPIITRSASTLLYLADGQTTVIGGLSTQSENDGESGIPFLKDVPLLGYAFRNTTTRSSFSDTLIFITPHILPAAPVAAASSPPDPAAP